MAVLRKRLVILIASVIAFSLVQSPVAADSLSRRDPKDTPGRLDIRRISHGHKGEDAFVHRVSMFRRVPARMLRPGGRGTLRLYLYEKKNIDDGTLVQLFRRVDIVWRKGRLRGPIFDELEHDQPRIGVARVARPNRRTVRITIPRRALGDLADPPVYLWFAESEFRNAGRCSDPCRDRAPRGVLSHRVE